MPPAACKLAIGSMHSPDHVRPESMEFEAEWPKGKIKVETHRAVKVHVKVNVLEISRIDQTHETFTAVFTLRLYWIDPALRNFRSRIKYLDGQGNICEVTGLVIGCCGYNQQTKLVIQKAKEESANEKQCTCWKEKLDIEKELSDDKQCIAPTDVWYQSQPDWDEAFRPKWSVMNMVGAEEVLYHNCQLQFCSSAGGHVMEKYKIQATFNERLELHDLPFDKQVLRMKFVAEVPQWKVQFVPLSSNAGNLATRPGLPDAVPAEWTAVDHQGHKCRMMVTKPHGKGNGLGRFDVLIHVERRPSFYLYNVGLILSLLTLGSWFVLVNIDPEDVVDRASIQFILLLTTVGFKHLTVAWLPVKPYLTFLDRYILSSFMVQILAIVESTVIIRLFCSKIEDNEEEYKHRTPRSYDCGNELSQIDDDFARVLFGVLVFWHLIFLMCQLLSHTCSCATVSCGKCSKCYAWSCCCNCCGGFLRFLASLFKPCRTWQDVYQQNHVLGNENLLEPNPDEKGCPWGSIPDMSDWPPSQTQSDKAVRSVQADAAGQGPTLLQTAGLVQAQLFEEKPKPRRTKTRRAAAAQDAQPTALRKAGLTGD